MYLTELGLLTYADLYRSMARGHDWTPQQVDAMTWWQLYSVLGLHRPEGYWEWKDRKAQEAWEERSEKLRSETTGSSSSAPQQRGKLLKDRTTREVLAQRREEFRRQQAATAVTAPGSHAAQPVASPVPGLIVDPEQARRIVQRKG